MHSELKKHLQAYRNLCGFNPEKWVNNKAQLLNKYMSDNKLTSCIVGCSGGIDSSVTFALCKFAQNIDKSPIKHVVPLLLPMNTDKISYKRAIELCEQFNVKPMINPIGLAAIRTSQELNNQMVSWLDIEDRDTKHDVGVGDFAYGQLQSYLRTPYLYFTAQMMSEKGFPSIVMGTGNKDEDGYLAYFCKAGDGVVDVQLINDLHKMEVYLVGHYLKLPETILVAKPTADLWEGQTDEEELGVSYDFVELYTGYYLNLSEDERIKFIIELSEEANREFIKCLHICNNIHKRNNHKLRGIVNL